MEAERSRGDITVTETGARSFRDCHVRLASAQHAFSRVHRQGRRTTMGTFETIAVVTAVYVLVFVAHRASRGTVKQRV